MIYLPQDIHIQKERSGITVWIAQAFLVRLCNKISDNYLRKVRTEYKDSVSPSLRDRDILPDTGKAWRWAKLNNSFYFAYNNIPDKHPTHYRSSLPAQEELLQIFDTTLSPTATEYAQFEERFNYALKEHYKEYLHCYNQCTETQKTNLAKYAAVLEASVRWIREHNISLCKYEFIGVLAGLIKKHQLPYAPENVRILKNKLKEIQDGAAITEIAKLPRAGNSNREKYNDEEILSWILQLREMGANYTNMFIIRKIKDMCALLCKPAPSERWIGSIMERPIVNYLTAEQRFGSDSRFGNKHRGHQRFANALFAGDCWQVDGTRINLIAHKTKVWDEKKNKEVTLQQFLFIVSVRDVHSGDVLGYHYCITEDRWAVHNALKMAVKNAWYLPYEIIFDKFPGHNSQEGSQFLKELQDWGVKVTVSSDPNVKPQKERFFGTLQTVFMQESMLYYGQGIKSRRNYAHRSKEWVERMYREANKLGFDFGDACREATEILEAYRNTSYAKWSRKHATVNATPAELHELSEKPNVRHLEAQDYWFLFGLKKTLDIKHQGLIETDIQKVTYRWRCTDYHVISNYSKVLVCYDYDDLSQIMIYDPAGGIIKKFLGRVTEEREALRYGPNAEWGTIRERESKIKELDGYREQEVDYRKAVGSDITGLLHPLMIQGKKNYEQNESNYLLEQAKQPRVIDEGDDLEINVRNQY